MKKTIIGSILSTILFISCAEAILTGNSDEMEATIAVLQTSVETACNEPKTLTVCNKALAQTQHAIRVMSQARGNSAQSQRQLATLQSIYQQGQHQKTKGH